MAARFSVVVLLLCAILFLPSFFSHTFMHSRGSRKQLRDSRKKRTIVHRVYHFPRFFATRLLSPAGAGSFFEVTVHLVRTALYAYILWDALQRGERGTLHYNYSVKKFKSLNTVRRTTIPTVLKLRGTRIRLCKRGESRDNRICNIKASYQNKPFYATLKHVCEHRILIKIFS